MNNKYLFEKLEQSHGVTVEGLVLVAFETLKDERLSSAFEEFTENEPLKICEVLGWKTNDEKLFKIIEDRIEEKSFAVMMYENDYDGFLAEIHIPEHDSFLFDEKGKVWASSVHPGCCRVEWVYAASIGELTDKIVDKTEEVYQEYLENFKVNQIKKNNQDASN